jgi:hypothetical protein
MMSACSKAQAREPRDNEEGLGEGWEEIGREHKEKRNEKEDNAKKTKRRNLLKKKKTKE